MDVEKFLNHPFVKISVVAEKLYPNLSKKSATSQLQHKIRGSKGRISPRKLSDKDKIRLAEIWAEMKKEIEISALL